MTVNCEHGLSFIVGPAIILSLASGCHLGQWVENGFKLGPNYKPVDAAVAENWIDDDDPRVLAEPPMYEDWWSVFNDPQLNEMIEEARQQNLTLRQAGLRVLAARAQRNITIGNLFPQTQQGFGSFSHSRASANVEVPFVPLPIRNLDDYQLGVGATWELDVWGRFRRAVESAEASLEASVFDYNAIWIALVAEVATAYADIRTFQERLAYAHENVEEQRGSLEMASVRAREGKTDDVAVHLAKSNLNSTESNIPELEIGLRQANNRLCTLLGKPSLDMIQLLGDGVGIPSAPAEIAVGIPGDLLRRRPDVRVAEREVAAQSAEIGIAIADLYPSISISGSYFREADKFRRMFRSHGDGGTLGVSFAWNLLNYGRIINNIQFEETVFDELVANYRNTVLQANQDVEDALVAFLRKQVQVEFIAEALNESQRALELLLIQYKEGRISFSPIFVMQEDVTKLRDRLASAQGEVATSLISVYKALGGGWDLGEKEIESDTVSADSS
jgi:NodT family efflux transporter outer membrane factor (OMF) lipoprotein